VKIYLVRMFALPSSKRKRCSLQHRRVDPPPSGLGVTLPALAERHCTCSCRSISPARWALSSKPAGRPPLLQPSFEGDRQPDGRTNGRQTVAWTLLRMLYAGSVNKLARGMIHDCRSVSYPSFRPRWRIRELVVGIIPPLSFPDCPSLPSLSCPSLPPSAPPPYIQLGGLEKRCKLPP